MYEIIKKKNIWFTFSGIAMALSVLALLVWGLRLGIDFTGGSLMEVSYDTRPTINQVEVSLQDSGLASLKIQPAGENDFILRLGDIDEPTHQQVLENLQNIQVEGVEDNEFVEKRYEFIGPIIGNELKSKALQAIAIVLIFIVIYIAYAFRKVSKPVASWKFGISAIIALIHDILIITGIFSAFGYFFGMEVDSLFVTALLTILGFSIHDTIVTFDRTRENLFKKQDMKFDEIVNLSVNQTIVRSLNTSITTLFVLLAIYIFGGETIKNFVLALVLGVIIGTYSSIFIASPLLSIWNHKKS
ncbi:protein translocase subunit SecF [Candidatus Parcubacteria bacterium]|jgi:preprotein translocase subunit SecF|nr:protein translocase subunit SecF [Candidatus Parcubacteria bacterium]MBT7227969.1 protein translocase subunit SecF [Candidatus Parcubacteria bacterium]